MISPMQIMQMMRGGSPQQFIQQMMGDNQIMQNPMAKNVLNMAQNGDISGIEKMGRNIAKEKGIDFDKAFNNFKSQFPMQ